MYNELGSSCSDQVQSTTQPFGGPFGVATHPATGTLYVSNIDLPMLSQCQYSGTQLSDCGNGYSVGNGASMGISGNTLYTTSFVDTNITACDLTSNICNTTVVNEVKGVSVGMAFANNSMYLTTISTEIVICEIDGLQIGPCRAQNLTGADNSTFTADGGLLGIAVNETSGVFYFPVFLMQSTGLISCDLNLSSCVYINVTSANYTDFVITAITSAENKLFLSVLEMNFGGGLLICDQAGQGINSCVLSGNQTNPITPFAFGISYSQGSIFTASALFLVEFAACTVDLTTNTASDCLFYLQDGLLPQSQEITSTSSPVMMTNDILGKLNQKFRLL